MKTATPSLPLALPALPDLSGGAQDALKLTALACMLVDHADKVALGGAAPALGWIGRLAFPLFALLIAYNLEVRGVSPRRYVWPMVVCALVSQPFYALAFQRSQLNIFFTLLLGIGLWSAHKALRERGHGWAIWLAALPFVAVNTFTDYPLLGCAIVPVWAALLRAPSILAWAGWAFVSLCLNAFAPEAYMALLVPVLIFVTARALKDRPRLLARERWLVYGFYPGHLMFLVMIQEILKG